ncbi:hypothetical protein ACJJTC_010991, partial [Scirpophaga incertulas]
VSITGLTAERERERRIADHHQTEAEMQHTCSHTKNAAYYDTLHSNKTYKLSEALRDKPFHALNATTKAKILAYLCDELLQNKSVLRQIESSLEHLNQLKKERYLMDMKIRKVRVMHQRKVRSEQSEKQQALALERMQRLVEESTANLSRSSPSINDEENPPSDKETPKKDSPQPDSEHKVPSPYKDSAPEESDKELSPLKDLSNSMKNKEILNNNKEECSPADNSKLDKDSVIGDCDAILSDLESEGTQPEEDEDKNLSSEELSKKLDKLMRQSELQMQQLAAGSHALRATCYGQDRYWRRYWSLGKCGGIFVEGMESAQPEIMQYHQTLEINSTKEKQHDTVKKRKKGGKDKKEPSEEDTTDDAMKEEALKTEMELKSIKSELNLSDHTQIIKYEPNVKHGACKVEGSSIKMEEKYIQHKQNNEEDDMLDIEDSIPTAFLVQKPSHKPMYAAQAEPMDKPQEIVKVENVVKNEDKIELEENKDQLVNNLEELRKMAEAVSIQLDAAKKAEAEVKEEKEIKREIKKETVEPDLAQTLLYTKMQEGKWFSILRHESSFLNNINETGEKSEVPAFCDNDHTCAEVVLCQGHKWDVSNNLHLLNDPSLFTLNSMVTSVQVPTNNVYADSSLTMSGLDQSMMDASLNNDESVKDEEMEEDGKEQDNLCANITSNTTEATLGAVLQAEHGNSSAPSPQNSDSASDSRDNKGIARGLTTWRDAVARCNTSAQLSMVLHALEAAVAWDKSIMKANCQFCLSGDNEDQLLLCDGCDKGYHTYCFKPRMDKIPEGDWYCWECVNKARGERVCIVCGGSAAGRTIPCALCSRAYHQDCHYPPLPKNPRGKWYCANCISRAPPKKPRNTKKRDNKHKDNNTSIDLDQNMVPRGRERHGKRAAGAAAQEGETKRQKIQKELQFCKNLLCDMECHEHAWPFLIPVNTKQFPQYKKVIKCPMDLSTIKRKLQEGIYKCKEEFASDVRLIFSNCEVFNEDDSPVGRAGHNMRHFFEERWPQL